MSITVFADPYSGFLYCFPDLTLNLLEFPASQLNLRFLGNEKNSQSQAGLSKYGFSFSASFFEKKIKVNVLRFYFMVLN